MRRLQIAAEARSDLKEIYLHIAREHPDAAKRLRDQLRKQFRLLAHQPLLGQARPDLAEGLRMLPVGRYLILYMPVDRGASIVRVLHSARDVAALF